MAIDSDAQNEALANLLRLAGNVLEDPNSTDDATQLATEFIAFEESLSEGGELPDAWNIGEYGDEDDSDDDPEQK